MNCRTLCLTTLLFLATAPLRGADENARWWPVQAVPKTIVRTILLERFPQPHGPHHMLAQSVAGLAAKAVNEGRGDELVWVSSSHPDLEEWFRRFRQDHPQLTADTVVGPWDLVDRYVQRGIIQGYILYRWDESPGKVAEDPRRPGIDCSVNVATSVAGVLNGVLIDERLEPQAQAHGLKLLLDARGQTARGCFKTYREKLNRRLLCMQDPRIPNCRDLAIAHQAFTMFGIDEPAAEAMQWLEPLSPILGWSGGDEFQATRLSTIYGHLQTATNWCMNLPVLMAGAERRPAPQVNHFDPRTLALSERRSAVSFVGTDGDNVQWYEGGFFRASSDFWGSPDRGRIPYGWSCCFSQLTQLCPQVIDYALSTRTDNDWFIEWGGGYYYPDLFGSARADRWELLARHARRTWAAMQRNDVRIIGFNIAGDSEPDARKAYEVLTREMDGLLAILVFYYRAYEGGAGQTFWIPDRHGREVPVITARYSIWNNLNPRPRCGTPAKVAREVRGSVPSAPGAEPRYDWVISHVWSYFRRAPGADEAAENMTQDGAPAQGGIRGYTPAAWCAERLPESVRVVCPEELIWRIRMQHNPEQTRQLLQAWPR